MEYKWIIHRNLWILLLITQITEACIFYSKLGQDSEAEGVRFIRVREDMHVGGDILTLKAYPRDFIRIKGIDRSQDYSFFKIREINSTYVQVLLDKSLEDLVDRDVPQNLLKFKIECSSREARSEESSFLTITVYIEDINDNFPQFLNLPYIVNVDESTPVGTTIYQKVTAFDRDKPNTPNSDVQFSMGAVQDYGSGGPYFSLDSPHRPSIVLRRQLDFDEGIQKFEIPIIASDRGTPPKLSNTSITIYVQDNDDQPPKFTENVYRTRINEFYPITGKPIRKALTFLPLIQAHDQDSLNATLIYDIISGNEKGYFSVNSKTAIIYLDKEIDLEEESLPGNTFVLQLEARQRDSPLKRSVARVEIEIIDLNDNPPEFEVDLYNISIVENLPSGFSVLQVNAIDRDQGENSEFYYSVHMEKPSGAFVIDPRTGWITVRDQDLLDREARASITLEVQAIEKQEPYDPRNTETSSVQVEITLLDSNDNTPEFEMGNLYEFKINVDAPVGHVVGHIVAKDPDEGRNGMILYELQHPRGSGMVPFKLEANSGKLLVAGPLRRGRIAIFVEASDQPANPSERRFSLAVVTIEVVSHISDGSIDFVGAPYEFWVGADVPVGASVGQIRTNLEYEGHGDVVYDLLHSYAEGVPFAVEERSGIVTVIRDFEDFDRVLYEFEAVAAHDTFDRPYGQLVRRTSKSERQITRNGDVIEIDEGVISDSQNVLVTNVTIHIVNPDDERGILMRGSYADPIEFHVKENLAGAMIGQLLYKNLTKTSNQIPKSKSIKSIVVETSNSTAPTNSSLPNKEMFSAKNNRKDRQLYSKYLKNSTFKPTKKATNRKNRDANAETAFYVAVTPTVYFEDALMPEESGSIEAYALPLRRKFKPKIQEVDTQKHVEYESMVTYDSRLSNKEPVGFENFEATKYVHPIRDDEIEIDKELESESSVKLSARRRSDSPPAEVIITPRPPSLSRMAKQRNLVVIKPNDTNNIDLSEGRRNSDYEKDLRFLIANQQDVTDMIAITNDGTLMTLRALDREVRDTYRLTVIAEYSKGFVNGAGIYQVIIHVDDVNDNAPSFNHPSYSGIISENSALGTDVTMLNHQMIIKDADVGENAVFSVSLSGEGSHLFAIEFVNSTESKSKKISKSSTRQGQRYQRSIEKNFASLQLKLKESAINMLVPHYAIRFIGPSILDRERENYYDLRLLAKDKGGLSSEATLSIFVSDVNDNAPMFEKIAVFKDSGVEVLEHTTDLKIFFVDRFGSEMFNVSEENALNEKITYGISMANMEVMQVADRIHVGTPRFLKQPNETYVPTAPKRIRKSKQYEMPHPYFSISENVGVGNAILKITAIDEDEDENAQIFYEIKSETFVPKRVTPRQVHVLQFFGIDRLSGEIKVNRPLQAESEVRLNISAKDIGGLADFTTIRFKVLDINDHAPVFEKSWYTFDINEGSYAGNVLGKIVATDEDYGGNANISYSIETDKTIPFFITPQSGVLKVNGDLDRELKSRYEFKIKASDNSDDQTVLSSLAEIEVNVLDLNDNAPEFIGYDEIFYSQSLSEDARKLGNDNNSPEHNDLPVYKAYLNKNTEPGTFVKQISAVDKDFAGNGNGLVMYALHHNQIPYFFEIDSRDGIITTVSKFTRFHGYEHLNLTVIASDLGSPSKSSSAILLVNLQGADMFEEEEENRLFSQKYYEIEVEENGEVPMVLVNVNTSVAYKDEFFKWFIVPEMDMLRYEEFKIDPYNGTVWLLKPLDRETKDLYKLKIRADRVLRDGRSMPLITYPVQGERVQGLLDNEVRILVKVSDVNDNTPKFSGNGKPIIAVMPNNANFGFPVTKVQATDLDIGINAEVRYSLLNEPTKLFGIDAVTGRIRVLGSVLYGKQRVYGFDVKASDRRGADDGRSSIANVFVYVLDENRQVRLVIAGKPIEVEKDVDSLTHSLSEATGLDVRVRMLEPHAGDDRETANPSTDVYIYAVDPRSNSVIDMDDLQSTMSTITMHNLTSSHILELARLGSSNYNVHKNTHSTHNASLRAPELASIILAVIVFAGGLATALCVVCVKYKRRVSRSSNGSNAALAYSISGTPSTMRTLSKSSQGSTQQMLPPLPPNRPLTSKKHFQHDPKHMTKDRPREYIDVPLPQSVLNSTFNIDHDNGCMRYNQIHNTPQTILETSATSLHSSGRDSGLDLSRERSESPAKQMVRMLRDSQIRAGRDSRRKVVEKCSCEQRDIVSHGCLDGEDSSDSYEDSLKNTKVSRRTSLPRAQGFRRSMRVNPVQGSRGMRHSFSGNRDDLVQASPSLFAQRRLGNTRTSVSDLEERLRNLERSFREPFHLNNSRC